MLNTHRLFLVALALPTSFTIACGSELSGPEVVTAPGGICTTWTDWKTQHFVCAASGGDWTARPAIVTSDACATEGTRVGEANLARSDSGALFAVYAIRCPEEELRVARFEGGAWSMVSDQPANKTSDVYTQYGPSVASVGGQPSVLWDGNGAAFLSRWDGKAWQHQQYVEREGGLVRHPSLVADGGNLWIHYGEPAPAVFSTSATAVGEITKVGDIEKSAEESTLYTSLAVWQGNPVLAYTSLSDDIAWADQTDITKVAFWNGSAWTIETGGVQDTSGHDGSTPFLFVDDGQLFVMYADYTTDGLPAAPNQVRFRFRVKRWTGSAWARVGDESESIVHSPRHEFLYQDGYVFVNVVRPAPADQSTGAEQVVLGWNGTAFQQIGSPLATFTEERFRSRPGNIIPAP